MFKAHLAKSALLVTVCPTLELVPPTLVAEARKRASLSNRNARLRDIFDLRKRDVLSDYSKHTFFYNAVVPFRRAIKKVPLFFSLLTRKTNILREKTQTRTFFAKTF